MISPELEVNPDKYLKFCWTVGRAKRDIDQPKIDYCSSFSELNLARIQVFNSVLAKYRIIDIDSKL